MASHNQKGRKKKHFSGNFIGLEYGMMQSPAWRHLYGDSVKLFLDVWSRISHSAPNNGDIAYSTREAQKLLRCGSDKATRCLRQLVDLGFLAVERRGAFSVKTKLATTWRITLLPTTTAPATRDYQRWRPASAPKTGAESRDEKQNTAPIFRGDGTQNRCRDGNRIPKKPATAPKTGAEKAITQAFTAPKTGELLDSTIGVVPANDSESAARALKAARASATTQAAVTELEPSSNTGPGGAAVIARLNAENRSGFTDHGIAAALAEVRKQILAPTEVEKRRRKAATAP